MSDENKDRPANQSGTEDESLSQKGAEAAPLSSSDRQGADEQTGGSADSKTETATDASTGADVPAEAQPLPNVAGTLDPAAEIEAAVKASSSSDDRLKTEAKAEEALPGVEKPSMTKVIEGASEAGTPEVPEKAPTPRPQEGAASAKPSAPATPAKDAPPKATPPKAAPPKAAPTAGHKPAAPVKKGPAITLDITDDPFIDGLKSQFGDTITEAVATLGQQIIRVKKEAYLDVCRALRMGREFAFDMCTDLTAVHWPNRAGQEFELVLLLYCVSKNRRIRVKVNLAEGESCPSVAGLWAGADWMEREVYDMFGLKFEGHPDLRRILLPQDWPGHPFRKEYPIEYRDNEWTDRHIEYRDVDYDTSLIDVKYSERR